MKNWTQIELTRKICIKNTTISSGISYSINTIFCVFGGESGIRTRAAISNTTPLAGAPLRPLEYLSIFIKFSLLFPSKWLDYITRPFDYSSVLLKFFNILINKKTRPNGLVLFTRFGFWFGLFASKLLMFLHTAIKLVSCTCGWFVFNIIKIYFLRIWVMLIWILL